MKKNIVAYGIILGLLLSLTACNKDNDTTTLNLESSQTTTSEKVPEEQISAQEIVSKDGTIKIAVEDFEFTDKINETELIKNTIKDIKPETVEIYQTSPSGVALSAIKDERFGKLTKKAAEETLKANSQLKSIIVSDGNPEAGITFGYAYRFVDEATQKEHNEVCSVLSKGYLVCAVGEEDPILLTRLVNSVKTVETAK